MVIAFVSTSLLTILFYGKIFFTEQKREEIKENKRKMEFYNRVNIKGTPDIQDFKRKSNKKIY
jgi:hypothetical protein